MSPTLWHSSVVSVFLSGAPREGHSCEAYRSHCLQKWIETCLGIPSEMSTWVLRQDTHMLAGFGGMGTPHVQQRLQRNETHISSKQHYLDYKESGESVWYSHVAVAAGGRLLHVLHDYNNRESTDQSRRLLSSIQMTVSRLIILRLSV